MKERELFEGDVLQLNPDHKFGGMLVVVDEPKNFGCQGYLMSAVDFQATKFKGRAFIRCKFEDMEWVGQLHWMIKDNENEDES